MLFKNLLLTLLKVLPISDNIPLTTLVSRSVKVTVPLRSVKSAFIAHTLDVLANPDVSAPNDALKSSTVLAPPVLYVVWKTIPTSALSIVVANAESSGTA